MNRFRIFSMTTVLFYVLLFGAQESIAQTFALQSPNGSNVIEVNVGENIAYSVKHNEQVILDYSPVSMTIGGKELGVKPVLKNEKRNSVNQIVNPVVRVKGASITENYNELTLTFKGNYAVSFRAFDEGIAYRFETTMKGEVQVGAEQISYHFPKNFTGSFPLADGFYSHQERNYTSLTLNEFPDDTMSTIPALIHFDNGVKAVITEADLYDYPGYFLKKGKGTSLEAAFPYFPAKIEVLSDRDEKPVRREAFMAQTSGRRTFPWRMMAISDNDKELLENEMVYLLSRELKLDNTDWIKPGKVAWDWYNANNIYGVDFKSGINTETYKYYIDFASKYGLEYVILDEGWYDIKTNDLINPIADIRMEDLVSYGKEKNVGIILWVTWKALNDNLIPALDQFKKWDIKGIKVDFMQRDDQWMVQYYERVSKAAADRQMLVDFHGSYKPSGLRRAYPNLISRESVKGLEQNKWEGMMANPENDLQIPFTRMLAGPVDYTPGAMNNAQLNNYRWNFERPMSLGTRCHQLAMYVVYESPLQMLADAPSNYLKEAECMEFLSEVPSVWDETKALDAQYGDYVLMARKSGEDWYVGAMTDWDARPLEVDFSFLGEGKFNIDIYQDGVNADRYGSDFKRINQEITSSDKLLIHLAPGGGWVARIVKQ